jgi:two-component system sensor histidine kinase PilS (NtrC family)
MIAIRLVAITSVFLPYLLLQYTFPRPFRFDLVFYVAGITYVASLLYIILLRVLRHHTRIQAHIQFLGDLLLITALVHAFGGASSPFSILYFIVVIVAATLVSRPSALTVAAFAWLLYAGVVLGLQFGWIAPAGQAEPDVVSHWRLAYSLAIHLFGFFAVALLTSRMSQTVTRALDELESQRGDLAALQVVHRDVIESMPSGLITCSREGTITSANTMAKDILQADESTLLGRPIWDADLFDRGTWEELRRGTTSRSRVRRELVFKHSGGERNIGYSLTPLASAEGRPAGYVFIFQDLTDWRALQEELRVKDRMAAVGELAAGIAHEIGNPLAAVSGSAQMLSGAFDSGSSQGELLGIILKESQRLDRIIKGFLKYARPKERTRARVDIAELLGENVELLRHSPEVSPDHSLELEVDPPSAFVISDPDQITQVFWNLARNALKAMPNGGRLKIEGKLDGNEYRLRFMDSGRGMDENERANLFHPYQSFFDTGSGIGMAIVYRIVQQHGGRIGVESEPGLGTTITVVLPTRPVPLPI